MTSRSNGYAPLARTRARPGSAAAWVERAGEAHFLVVDAIGVDLDPGVARQAAEREDGAAGADEAERALPRFDRPGRLDHDVRALGIGRDGTEGRGERAPLLA